MLGRRAGVDGGHQPLGDRLEHQALRGGDLAQRGELLAPDHPEVGVREHPALERLLADPDDVGGEVREAVLGQARGHARVVIGRLAGEHEQLLGAVATRRAVEHLKDRIGGVQVRLMGGERAVLAVAPARTRERQRVVTAERDPSAHLAAVYEAPGAGLPRGADAAAEPPTRPAPMLGGPMRRLLLATLLAAGLGGCGLSSGSPSLPGATLVLDFTPNAVHAGIYEALARGDDVRAGVRLRVVAPSASTDSVRLLQTGRADFAILDIHDLAIARARGEPLVAIMAIVQRPLAAVIAAPSISRPQALAGRTVGITGVPSDTAVLHSIVAGAGQSPARVRTITIGFDAVGDLLAGRVAAATAFWNDEGVAIRARRPGFHVFRVDRYGAPAYPELVLVATASALRARPRPRPPGRARDQRRLPAGPGRARRRRAGPAPARSRPGHHAARPRAARAAARLPRAGWSRRRPGPGPPAGLGPLGDALRDRPRARRRRCSPSACCRGADQRPGPAVGRPTGRGGA